MKLLLITLTFFAFSTAAFAGVRSCNYKTSFELAGTATLKVPQGSCQNFGLIRNGATERDCKNAAEREGYDCFQVTELQGYTNSSPSPEDYRGPSYAYTIPVCYACY